MLLHFSALYQEIDEVRLTEGLACLYEKLGDQMFRLNKIPFQSLENAVKEVSAFGKWSFIGKAPGILRSVCDFFFAHGGLRTLLAQSETGEAVVAALAQEIFMMGKGSVHRFKARYFLWLCRQVAAGNNEEELRVLEAVIPITAGHVRFMSWLGPYKGKSNPPLPQRLERYNAFLDSAVSSGASGAFLPLEAFLQRTGVNAWKCHTLMQGCLSCPLQTFCPGKIS